MIAIVEANNSLERLGGGRKELDYRYILKVEPIVFAHGLDMSFERRIDA